MVAPRNTWAYGKDLLDAMYNVETVFLHQNDVIKNGNEDCHHLTIGVVGAGGAGKTSVIRKLTGQSFCRDHIPTEILDTSTIDPAYVSEKYIEATSWRTVQEKTDTEDVISHRVTKTLYESAIHSRGSMKTLVLRQFLFFFLVQMTCFCTLAWGAQPLASICLCMLYGVLIVARSETMLRFGLGFATNTYIMVWYIATSLSNAAENGQVPVSKLLSLAVEILVTSAAWGLTAGFSVGLIPGMASGLCVIQLSSSTEHSRSTLDTIFPGTVKALLMQEFSSSAIFYWLTLNVLSFGIFSLVNKRHTRYVLAILFIPCLVISYGYSHLGIIEMDVWILFPVFVLGSWPVCLHTISWARSLGSEQKAAGLRKNDLINTTVQSFFPGFLLGATCGVYLLGGKIKMKTLNDFFECVAIPVLIFFLSRSCAIHQYFSPSIYKNKLPAKTHKNQLHQCFKLLVRDFAGQMVYHCIHQPFLPKYGIFICVFSWRKAREHSLRFAMGEQTAGNDECLEEILFWLKNISMRRLHPNAQAGDSANTDNLLDCNDIKSVFLVATHADVESCGLSDEQKLKIMNYYKQAIKKHTDVYTSIQFKVSEGGEISVENSRDGVQDEGIETLKRCVLDTAQEVITHCFPKPVPVYFWCWLKQKRDRCMETGSPPCELLAESDIDMDARYMSVYPQCTFNTMINMFCNIGEIFLVRNNDENGRAIDYYIFFNLQFLIDFMKDIITIDETKRADCLNAKEWQKLDRDGKASVNLLKIHLKRFYKNHKMTQKYSDKELVRQPLVNSMLQLDFMFIIGEEFYIPQLLPKLSNQHNQQDHFTEVSDMLWEYVFDFQEFDFHHEYVFFRLLAQCANDNHCQIRQVCCDWASIYRISDQILNQSTDAPQEQWFTLSCEQRGKDGGQHNRIYLRTSKDCNRQHSLDILQLIKETIVKITRESFSKLGGKLAMFYNCPNRATPSCTHMMDGDPQRIRCGEFCENNKKTHQVRIAPDGIPYVGVSNEVKDWLCVQLDDERFNSLVSYLRNINMKNVTQQFTRQSDKTREEVKAGLLHQWTTQGYDASLNALFGAFDRLGFQDIQEAVTAEFPL